MEHRKVVIIGAGHVGSHCAYNLAAAGDCEEIVLVDLLPEKAAAQALDVADSVSFMDHAVTIRSGGYGECADAALTVVAIGEPRLPGQTRLDLLGRSVELLKPLAKELKPLKLTCPVVTITNPADIVAHWLRGTLELERWQCFGTGTLLDTARLVRCVSQGAGVDRRRICIGGERRGRKKERKEAGGGPAERLRPLHGGAWRFLHGPLLHRHRGRGPL